MRERTITTLIDALRTRHEVILWHNDTDPMLFIEHQANPWECVACDV